MPPPLLQRGIAPASRENAAFRSCGTVGNPDPAAPALSKNLPTRCTIRSTGAAGWIRFCAGVTRAAIAGILACGSSALAAADFLAGPDTYRSMLPKLRPGDRMLLAPGEYAAGLPLHGISGAPDAPIVIRGPSSGKPARFLARQGANTISLKNAAHIVIDSLELDGQGRNADAVKAESESRFAHHITLSRLRITGHDKDQLIVGISVQSPAWDWVIRDCVIDGAGTGMYLGRSDGTTGFVGALIERNVILDTTGYNVQIKHQRLRPPVPGMPHDRRDTVIRHNVFSKRTVTSVPAQGRPNLLVGHLPTFGPGSDDVHVIYGNLFYENKTEALFQGEGNIALYNNVFVSTGGSAIAIQPHNGRPRAVAIFNNTVLARDTGISVSGVEPGLEPFVGGNLIFAARPLAGARTRGNLVRRWEDAAFHLRAPFAEPPALDLSPQTSGLQAEPRLPPWVSQLPDVHSDFDGLPRAGRDGGGAFAYRGTARPIRLEGD